MRKWIAGLCLLAVAAFAALWLFGARVGLPVAAWQNAVAMQVATTRDSTLRLVGLAPPEKPKPPQLSEEPVLRVEIGQHNAPIHDMAINEAKHLLATASDDKTVRVWTLPDATHKDLQLADVLRPPLLPGKTGIVYCVAISPSGRLIAAGTAIDNLGRKVRLSPTVYVFDRESGQVVKPLSVTDTPSKLAFSPDGKFLLAGIAGKGGLRAWRISDWQEVAKDTSYRDSIQGLAVDVSGRVATSSADGFIRLYSRGFKQLKSILAPDSKHPAEVAFAPDGGSIALAHFDVPVVTMLDGQSLEKLRALPMPGMGEWAALGTIAWSPNGRYVFAGGHTLKDLFVVHRWDIIGDGAPVDLHALQNQDTIMEIVPYGNGGVAVASADTTIGAYAADGTIAFKFGAPLINTYIEAGDLFRISPDASVIQLPAQDGESVRVDLIQHRIESRQTPDRHLTAATSAVSGLSITGLPGEKPMLSRPGARSPVPVAMPIAHEMAFSSAVAPSGKLFTICTTWHLWLFSGDGKPLWRVSLPVGVMRSVFTPDERYIIAEGYDGVARWFALKKDKAGKPFPDEVLVLYADKKTLLWVAWTPAGYYDASVQGEDLIGWHINREPDQSALFYGASRFRNLFYRPDAIRTALATGKESPPPDTKLLLDHLPPIVRILGVEQSQDGTVHVRYVVSSNRPVPNLRVMVDGAVQDRRGARSLVTGRVQELTLAAPEGKGDHLIAMSAAGSDTHFGDTDSRQFTPTISGKRQKHNLYALVIGVGHFSDRYYQQQSLEFPASDADAIAAALNRQGEQGYPYDKVHIVALTDKPGPNLATLDRIHKEMTYIERNATPNDVAVLYLAGHGDNYPDFNDGQRTNRFVFLTYNTRHDDLKYTSIRDSDIVDFERDVHARRVLFIDTCYSGLMAINVVRMLALETASNEWGATVFASSASDKESWEDPDLRHGVFTAAVLDAFHGSEGLDYDRATGRFTQADLVPFLPKRVKALARKQRQQDVIPANLVPEFDLARVDRHN